MRNLIVYENWRFSDDSVAEGGVYLEQSLPGDALGYDTIEPVVRCSDKNIVNFPPGAKMYWYYRDQLRGIYYVQSIQRQGPGSYAISGISAVGRLSSMVHTGGIYTGQPAAEVIREICGSVPVIVKTSLQDIPIHGWLPYVNPPEKSARDNLAQVLFALGASLGTDMDGILRVEPLFDGISNVVDRDRIYEGGTVEYETPVSAVSVTEHQYIPGVEEATLFEGSTEEGHLVTFDAPHSGLAAEGFTIRASGANWARLSAGAGTLTGKPYIHTTRLVTETVTVNTAENVKSVSDCTLITLLNSVAAARRMAAYYRCAERIKVPVSMGTERPGQMISVYNPYDRAMDTAVISSMEVTMSGVLKAETAALVGFLPPQPGDVEYFNAREILTEDGEYQFPEGVTSAVAVLGSGGTGGFSGLQGHPMSYPPPTISVKDGDLTWRGYNTGYGAEGGEPGQAGPGGKVLQINFSVQPGQKFRVKIGKGGAGGVYSPDGSVAGSPGEATIFGEFSSENGGVLAAGYTDAISGEVYSRGGDRTGIAGGRGSGLPQGASHGYEVGPDVVDYDGHVWHAGATTESGLVIQDIAQAKTGNGGGAAVGSDGALGQMGRFVSRPGGRWAVYGGAGGHGGDAVPPAKQTRRGWGGNGGNGRGGEGGSGAVAVTTSDDLTGVDRGRPGYGSDGGDGGDGYVILYYSRAKHVMAGQLVTSNLLFAFDRLGRLFIV